MKYTSQQQRYIDSSPSEINKEILDVIGLMERTLKAQSRLLSGYRVGKTPGEWVFDTIKECKKAGFNI